jgi:hypothetical protein
MSNEKYSFVVVKYPDASTAEAALATVRQLAKEGVVKLKDAVALTKNEKGKLQLHQTKTIPPVKAFSRAAPSASFLRFFLAAQPGWWPAQRLAQLLPCSIGASKTNCSKNWAKI